MIEPLKQFQENLARISDREVNKLRKSLDQNQYPDHFQALEREIYLREQTQKCEAKNPKDVYAYNRRVFSRSSIIALFIFLGLGYLFLPQNLKMFPSISLVISFIIGSIALWKISTYDVFAKKPLLKLINVALFGGTIAYLLTMLAYRFMPLFSYTKMQTWWGGFAFIGPIEELTKLVALVLVYKLLRINCYRPSDGILYISCIAIGFSLIETYSYANLGQNNEHLLLVRILICTPAHIAFSFLNGLAFYLIKREGYSYTILLRTYVLSILFHGVYDAVLFLNIPIVHIILVIVFYRWLILTLTYTNVAFSMRQNLNQTIVSSDQPLLIEENCEKCHSVQTLKVYRIAHFTFAKCPVCEACTLTRDDLFLLFHYFAPSFKKLEKQYKPIIDKPGHYSLFVGNEMNETTQKGFFKLDDTQEAINILNQDTFTKMSKGLFLRLVFGNQTFIPGQETKIPPFSASVGKPVIAACIGLILAAALMWYSGQSHYNIRATEKSSETVDNDYFTFECPAGWQIKRHVHQPGQPLILEISHGQYYNAFFTACDNLTGEGENFSNKLLDSLPSLSQESEFVKSTDQFSAWGSLHGKGVSVLSAKDHQAPVREVYFVMADSLRHIMIVEAYLESYAPQLVSGREMVQSSFKLKEPGKTGLAYNTSDSLLNPRFDIPGITSDN